MLDWSCRLATWFHGEGYAGHLGLDFVEYADPATGAMRTLLAEVHPRVDSATEPLTILARLNAEQRAAGRPESRAFVSGTLDLGAAGPARLERAGGEFLYSAESGRGVVALPGTASERCRVVMLGGSRDEVLRAYGELQTWCRRGPRGG